VSLKCLFIGQGLKQTQARGKRPPKITLKLNIDTTSIVILHRLPTPHDMQQDVLIFSIATFSCLRTIQAPASWSSLLWNLHNRAVSLVLIQHNGMEWTNRTEWKWSPVLRHFPCRCLAHGAIFAVARQPGQCTNRRTLKPIVQSYHKLKEISHSCWNM
jgi:hypothetical protein